jgi:hypothetical protein
MKKIPVIFSCVILISLLALEYLFLLFELFDNFPQIGIVFHLIGGAATGVLMYYLFYGHLIKLPSLLQMLFIIGQVSFAAVGWECYEWLHSYASDHKMQVSLNNTMEDLFTGLLGGGIACCCILLSPNKRTVTNIN